MGKEGDFGQGDRGRERTKGRPHRNGLDRVDEAPRKTKHCAFLRRKSSPINHKLPPFPEGVSLIP